MNRPDMVQSLNDHTEAMIAQCQELARQISCVGRQLRQARSPSETGAGPLCRPTPSNQAALQRFLLCETVLQQQSTMLEQVIVALGAPDADGVLPLTPEEQRLWCESVRRERAIRRCLPLLTLATALESVSVEHSSTSTWSGVPPEPVSAELVPPQPDFRNCEKSDR